VGLAFVAMVAAYAGQGPAHEEPEVFQKPGLVVDVHKPGCLRRGSPDGAAVSEMMEAGILKLTGETEYTAAWKRLVGPGDIVGIKVDCSGGARWSTGKAVTNEIIRGLKSAGVLDNDIIVFDRFGDGLQAAGYRHNSGRNGVRCFASEAWMTPAGYAPYPLYEGLPAGDGKGSRLSTIVSEKVTKIINVPVLSDDPALGISGALENVAFGVFDNTDRFLPVGGDPAIAEMWTQPDVGEKVVLNVLDALKIQFDRGPSWDPQFCWEYSSVLFSTDPVALDTVGLWLVDNQRVAHGLPDLEDTNRPPTHVAAAAKLELGVGDLRKVDLVTVDLPKAK
jgi:hypothetical protein